MGVGITQEDQINMDVRTALTTKWGSYQPENIALTHFGTEVIKEACPWFFEMCELIAECPNHVPVGLGNNETAFNMSASSKPNSEFVSEDGGIEERGDTRKWKAKAMKM
jgi:hypothetical protein